jgi:signal transduction histidine kinase
MTDEPHRSEDFSSGERGGQQLAEVLVDLNVATRRLMRAESRTEIADIAVEATSDVLGHPVNGLRLFDRESETLELVACSDATADVLGPRPTYSPGENILWETYQNGGVEVVDDVSSIDDGYERDGIVSAMYLSLGDFGTLSLGAPELAAFDETDRRLAEILAANVVTALEREEQTRLLRQRERELERQNDRLEEFASVLSHDLRNPLSVASGFLELARDACETDTADPYFDRVERAHDRMSRLVSDLLTLARQGETVGQTEPVSIEAVAREAWRSVDTAAATLDVQTDSTVEADRERLTTLFENLFRNAVTHGGSAVTVRVVETSDGFAVADDGVGIDPADRDRVFERGYTTSSHGSGFGLSIVEGIVDAHGWTIRAVESEAGGARLEVGDVTPS